MTSIRTSHSSLLFLQPVLLVSVLLISSLCEAITPGIQDQRKPNFLIVVADDMGWSDIGVFGGEIRTPSLDRLASKGLSMTQFYVAPTCSPSRAMLLTGLDHHMAGYGTMSGLQAPNQLNSRNYAAQLHGDVVTIAEVLRHKGYETFASGKWHLNSEGGQGAHSRGFDRSFVLLQAGASHFADSLPLHPKGGVDYLEDGKPVELPADFYSSISYTDKMLEYLETRNSDTPFFAYLAYTAPHDPLQVPDEWLDRYRGAYAEGPAAIRRIRAQRLQRSGLLAEDAELWQPPNFPSWVPMHREAWFEREPGQRELDARPMEIYASMVELMDQQIGRVLDYLQRQGEIDNTYIIFMSDNGPSATTPLIYSNASREWLHVERDNRPENMGRPGSHLFYGMEWAAVSASPWKMFKGSIAEGGVRSPLIASGPTIAPDQIVREIGHIRDITPTLYQLAGVVPEHEDIYKGKIMPQGKSLVSLWQQNDRQVEEDRSFGLELFGNRAFRKGRWKIHNILPPIGSGEWELYDMRVDPGETKNIAADYPEQLRKLIDEYEHYAELNGVIQPNISRSIKPSKLYAGECDWWCEIRLDVIDFVASHL